MENSAIIVKDMIGWDQVRSLRVHDMMKREWAQRERLLHVVLMRLGRGCFHCSVGFGENEQGNVVAPRMIAVTFMVVSLILMRSSRMEIQGML